MSVPVKLMLSGTAYRALEATATRQGTTVRELIVGAVERSVLLSARRRPEAQR